MSSIWLAEATSRVGAVVGGRATYEAARHWGDKNARGLRGEWRLANAVRKA